MENVLRGTTGGTESLNIILVNSLQDICARLISVWSELWHSTVYVLCQFAITILLLFGYVNI